MLAHTHSKIQLGCCLQSTAQHTLQGNVSAEFACAHLCKNDLAEAWCGLQCLTGAGPEVFKVREVRAASCCVSDNKGKPFDQKENSYHETLLVLFVSYLSQIT